MKRPRPQNLRESPVGSSTSLASLDYDAAVESGSTTGAGAAVEALASLGPSEMSRGPIDGALADLLERLCAAVGGAEAGLDRIDPTGSLVPEGRHPPEAETPADACRAALAAPGASAHARGWDARAVAGPAGVHAVLWTRPGPGGAAEPALSIAAAAVGWALENARLRDGLERAMGQVLEDDERMLGRMGLDIHDGPTQQLSVALLEVQLLEAEIEDADEPAGGWPEGLRAGLGRIYETLGGALHEMRELIGHLRPAQFKDRALDDILGDAIGGFEARSDIPVERRIRGEFQVNGVSVSQRITFYRILQEALANAHRHGHASGVVVDLESDARGTRLVVSDDGEGFDPGTIMRDRERAPSARHGLRGMEDRARLLGGSFSVESTPGEGTTVSVFLPPWNPPESLEDTVVDE